MLTLLSFFYLDILVQEPRLGNGGPNFQKNTSRISTQVEHKLYKVVLTNSHLKMATQA